MKEYINIEMHGSGKYLPAKKVLAHELDKKLGLKQGWCLKATGVETRYFAENETTVEMGVHALEVALGSANILATELDAIVSVSAIAQQPIPCTGALIASAVGLPGGLMTFDINATCLGFLLGLDILATLIQVGRYKKVALVASEIASLGLNWEQHESACLFGDGAVAMIIGGGPLASSKILASNFETFPTGAEYCQIKGGLTRLPARNYNVKNHADYCFDMQGPKVFKLMMQKIPGFVEQLLQSVDLKLSDINLFIAHQASYSALKLLRKRLKLSEEQYFINVENQGNTISASVPMALHDAISQGRVQKGDKIILLGSSAGVSLGVMIIEY